MDVVMSLVKSKVRPLAVGGSLVSGKALAALTAAYVEAVNQGECCLVCVLDCSSASTLCCRGLPWCLLHNCSHHCCLLCVLGQPSMSQDVFRLCFRHAFNVCPACCVAGAVPQLVTAWQGVSRAETQKAFDDAAAAYAQRFTPDLDSSGSAVEEQQLYEQHQVRLLLWMTAA
jgi:hypothetical protein